ncbi:hypothetical protein N9D84_04685, partial [Planktomarina temperata]|nr:hypothetical protein [Planktomarina temperata]
ILTNSRKPFQLHETFTNEGLKTLFDQKFPKRSSALFLLVQQGLLLCKTGGAPRVPFTDGEIGQSVG